MVSFTNCKYKWQLQETLKEHFDSLSFQTPEEFGKVADAMFAACEDYQTSERKERINHIDTLNDVLKLEVQNILNYLDEPYENISVQFVNENQHLFGLSEVISQEEAFAAYQELVKNILEEIAADIKKTSQAERKNIIEQKEAQLKKKQEEQLQLKAKKAPTPGSEKSTHELFLTNMLGGSEKFDEVSAKLKAEPSISELRSSLGKIEGILTDEDGLRWSFEWNADDDEKCVLFMRNYDALRLCIEEPAKSIPANEVSTLIALPANTFPKGQFQYQSATIKEILLTRIQEVAYISFCMAFGKMNNINAQSLNAKLDELVHRRQYLPRAQMKAVILGLVPPPPHLEIVGNFLAHILQALNGVEGPNQGQDRAADDSNDVDMLALHPGIFPGLRAFILRNRPADEEEVPQVNSPAQQAPVVPEPIAPRRNPRRATRDAPAQRRRG